MGFTYETARPGLAVDIVVFGFDSNELKAMLIRRKLPPDKGCWALPGGFVRIDEGLDQAAARALREETGIEQIFLEQLAAFGAVDRDPSQRVVSVAYVALVPSGGHAISADADACDVAWFSLCGLPKLAFDHAQIVEAALERLRQKIRHSPIGFELLPRKFTLGQLQLLYEAILGAQLDKRNFRKRVLALDLIEPLQEFEANVSHRPARLYRFNRRRYRQLSRSGFNFEI